MTQMLDYSQIKETQDVWLSITSGQMVVWDKIKHCFVRSRHAEAMDLLRYSSLSAILGEDGLCQ